MTLVMKFGGTSVGSAAAMKRTAELIRAAQQDWGSVIVVASAMSQVTDLLLRGAHGAIAGDKDAPREVTQLLREKHETALENLVDPGPDFEAVLTEINGLISRYHSLCRAVLVLGELTPRALDVMSSMGERMSVRILAAYLRQIGMPADAIDADTFIVTDNNFQAASPLDAETAAGTARVIKPLLTEGIIPIVTGFMGATVAGTTTTLGRGGSDYSAAIIGQALPAQEVWIWTDVDGVMTTDPRIVPEARSIPSLTYREVAELAYYGAKVLHPKTIRPVVENDIPLRIKNTFNPDHPGTLIVPDDESGAGTIKAVTAIKDVGLITVAGRGMLGVPGIAARTFGAVARTEVSVLLISQASSEQSICFATPAGHNAEVVASLEAELAEELKRRDIDSINSNMPVTIIHVVGAGMQGTPGIAGQIFGILGQHKVNIIAIAQGSSECSISLVVASEQTAEAVKLIHSLI